MSLSQLARSIKESPTLKLNQVAAQLREKGEPVIHLGGGEPKSKTPIDAVLNCIAQLHTGDIKYAPASGLPGMKKAIVQYTEQNYGKVVEPKNIVVSSGAKQAIMMALYSIVNPGDEVIFPAPYWVSYPDMVRLAAGTPVVVTPKDGSFHPTLEEMTAAVTPRTKAIMLNSPNNPSGVMYSPEFIAGIVALGEKKGLYLIMDDLYNRLVFEGKSAPNAFEFATEPIATSRLVVVQGVSKMYAMTGFRIGWAIAAPELITAMGNIQGHQTSGPATSSQWAAIGALNGVQTSIDSLRLTLENNRNIMMERLKGFEKVKVTKPDATFYCFPDFSAYMKDSPKLAEFLLEKVRVVTVPGREFGMDGHLRLSYCGTVADVTEGLDRIRWALDPNAPSELRIGDRKLVRDWK